MTNVVPDPLQIAMKSAHFAKLSEYLRETPFADVEQGISEIKYRIASHFGRVMRPQMGLAPAILSEENTKVLSGRILC